MRKFAFVDIETNGSTYYKDEIIELGIIIYEDGKITQTYDQLFSCNKYVPKYIQNLTGIKNADLKNKPLFSDQAQTIFSLLEDSVFVAHNVSYDYNFLKFHLGKCGLNLNTEKVCSLNFSKKLFPESSKHSLETVIKNLNINVNRRHRALDDCKVVFDLYKKMENEIAKDELEDFLSEKIHKKINPKINGLISNLPSKRGVYRMYTNSECVYVGQSKNIKNRIKQHYYKSHSSKRFNFLNKVDNIQFTLCNNEFETSLLEIQEIKLYKPRFNKSLKHISEFSVLYFKDDQFQIKVQDTLDYELSPLAVFSSKKTANNFIEKKLFTYQICNCFYKNSLESCDFLEINCQTKNKELMDRIGLCVEDFKNLTWPENEIMFLKSSGKYLAFYKFIYLGYVKTIPKDTSRLLNSQKFDFQTYRLLLNSFDNFKESDIIYKTIK